MAPKPKVVLGPERLRPTPARACTGTVRGGVGRGRVWLLKTVSACCRLPGCLVLMFIGRAVSPRGFSLQPSSSTAMFSALGVAALLSFAPSLPSLDERSHSVGAGLCDPNVKQLSGYVSFLPNRTHSSALAHAGTVRLSQVILPRLPSRSSNSTRSQSATTSTGSLSRGTTPRPTP